MQLIHDVKGTSKIILIFLLIVAFAVGALLSYVWTMGFYAPNEFHLPSRTTTVIESVAFNRQDASFVNVTVLNPSYSPSNVTISRIQARTLDDNILSEITVTSPQIPYTLRIGEVQTFRCNWNWANYTGIKLPPSSGKNVKIDIITTDGFGEIAFAAKPLVVLSVTDASFNSNISLTSFNVTVQNIAASVTYVNVTSITVNVGENISTGAVTPSLPYGLAPGASAVTFTVQWDWATFRNQTVTITVHTRQGYIGQLTTTTP